jgi:hypothetical protein
MFPACGATITAIMTAKSKPYKLLREKMSPKAREAAEKKTQELLSVLLQETTALIKSSARTSGGK